MSTVPSLQARSRATSTSNFISKYALVLLLVLLIVALALHSPSFSSAANVNDMLRSASISAIMFLGLTWVIAVGEIDVSFMSVAALANMATASMVAAGHGWLLAALAGIAAGAAVGVINGLLIARFRLPALVITIATGGLASSIAAALGSGTSIALSGTGFVGDLVGMNLGVLPLLAVLTALLYAAAFVLQDRLSFGHYMYAIEQNRSAVQEAGVPVNRLILMLFITSSTLSALAGVLLAANLSSGQPYLGTSYFIDGLTAVLLGGMCIKTGKPNVAGTLIGILFLGVLLSGAALLGWTDALRQIVRGLLLLVGIAIVVWLRKKPGTHPVL
jgi:ribose transport system permease protein